MDFRVIGSILSLLKDVFLEGQGLIEAARKNRKRLLALILVLLSIMTNFYLLPRVTLLAHEVHRLEKLSAEHTRSNGDVSSQSATDPLSHIDNYDRIRYYSDRYRSLYPDD